MYNSLHNYIKMEIIGYLDVRSFMNLVYTEKKTTELCKSYLKMKKNIFKSEKIEKNHKNSLYRMKDSLQYNKPKEDVIVKIVRICNNSRDPDTLKIYYWILCKMGKVGKKYTVYPNWSIVKSIDPDKFIPFY